MSVRTIFDQPSDRGRDSQLIVYAYEGEHVSGRPWGYLRIQALERTAVGNDERSECAEVELDYASVITLMQALDRWTRRQLTS